MKLPGFDILDKLGDDRMTVVWKASQTSLNRIVAIKILRQQYASDATEVQGFLSEGRMIAKLKHPGILQVYDVIQQDSTCYFVMEYVADTTLATRLEKAGGLPVKSALKIAFKAADALGYAWRSSHLIHRNLKPENIYMDVDDSIKIAFFGLSMVVNPVRTEMPPPNEEHTTIAGTPYYMSPEQARCSQQLDCRSDIYALGALLYHMLTGRMPFHEFEPMVAAGNQISGRLPHPRDLDASIQQNVANLVVRMMMKDPGDRPKNWEEVSQDLQKLLAGQLVLKKPDPNAVSTIEPEARTVGPSAAGSATAPAAPAGPRTILPLWIQLPAWGLILVWWYVLARFMIDYWAQ